MLSQILGNRHSGPELLQYRAVGGERPVGGRTISSGRRNTTKGPNLSGEQKNHEKEKGGNPLH